MVGRVNLLAVGEVDALGGLDVLSPPAEHTSLAGSPAAWIGGSRLPEDLLL